ncbi:MAG: MFS transporter, partial [Dehalococcoidia bacterium]|nr:MFS transporter [Dehalococcoidia bacterium]
MTPYTNRGLRRNLFGRFPQGVWAITLVGFFNSAGFSISLPFIALYLYRVRGLSMTEVGFILLGSGLFAAAAQLLSGLLTDRLGRRPLLLATTLGGLLLQFTMALVVGAHAAVWHIVLAYAGVRAALMMAMPPVQAVVADLTPKERLVEAYGLLRVGQNLGWAAGPAAGGYLAAALSYDWL